MDLDKLTKKLLEQIANLHEIPTGAVSLRKNGKGEFIRSTQDIVIQPKKDKPGIDIFVRSTCKNQACHIPVVITQNDLFDLVYNDFYIEDNADVTIVAGCGVHSDSDAGHDGVHTFHIGKNAKVNYIENHLAQGNGKTKSLNPTTIIKMQQGSEMVMNTHQIGGVDFANRKTKAILNKDATLIVNEKILTNRFNVAKTDFNVVLQGENCKCTINSRSVAKGESEQVFKSKLVGKSECFGQVSCDAIVLDNAKVSSLPCVEAKNSLASLSHEAVVGKIATEQITKLMTLGLTKQQAEDKIIEGLLK